MLPLSSSSHSLLPPPHIWTIGRSRFLCAGPWSEGVFGRWGSSRRVNPIAAAFFCWVVFHCSLSADAAVVYIWLLLRHQGLLLHRKCNDFANICCFQARRCVPHQRVLSWKMHRQCENVLGYQRGGAGRVREAPATFTADTASPSRWAQWKLTKSWHKPLFRCRNFYRLPRIFWKNHRNYTGKLSLDPKRSLKKYLEVVGGGTFQIPWISGGAGNVLTNRLVQKPK